MGCGGAGSAGGGQKGGQLEGMRPMVVGEKREGEGMEGAAECCSAFSQCTVFVLIWCGASLRTDL